MEERYRVWRESGRAAVPAVATEVCRLALDRPARQWFFLGRTSGAFATLMLLALAATPLVLPQGPAAGAAPLDTRDATATHVAPREDQPRLAVTTHAVASPPPRLVREPAPVVRPDHMRSRPAPLRQAQVAAPVEDGYVKDEGQPLLFDPRPQDSPGVDDRPAADVDRPPLPRFAPSLRHAPDAVHAEPMVPRPSGGILGDGRRAKNAGHARKRVAGSSGRTRKAARSASVRTSASGGLCPMTAGATGAQTAGWPCAAGSIDLAAALCTLFEGWSAPCEVRRPAARHRASARRGGRGYVSVNDIIMTALNRP